MSDSNDSWVPDSLASESEEDFRDSVFGTPTIYRGFPLGAQAAIVQIAEQFRHDLAEAGDRMPVEGREVVEHALRMHLLLMREGTLTTIDYRTAHEYRQVRTWLAAVARALGRSVERRDVIAGKQAVAHAASSEQPGETLREAAAQQPVQVWSAILADPDTARFVAEYALRRASLWESSIPEFPPVPEQLETRLPEHIDVRDLSEFIVDFGGTQRSLEP